ncbi:MAG: GNAT family N-acetyltransferase [Pseudomonadota bacterium]
MTTAPTIETERLVLRQPRASDLAAYTAFIMSDRACFVGREHSRFSAWKCFSAEAGHWMLHGYGPWAVTLKGAEETVGQVGVWQPEEFPERELRWLIWDDAEGKGIAYEAALAARDFDYRVHGTRTLVSYISADNARSIRLAERLGAHLDKDAHPLDPNGLVYRHPGPEALS